MASTAHHPAEFPCTCSHSGSLSGAGRPSIAEQGAGLLDSLAATLSGCHRKARQRQALADLDSRMLDDIGVTAAAARAECEKPFWS
jgi:uncharacterized protein YjiS (DUF1127 family)